MFVKFSCGSETVNFSADLRGYSNASLCQGKSAHNKMYGSFYSFKQNLFIPCTEMFVYEIFENIPSLRNVFVFYVYLLNLQFRTAGVYSIRVFYSGRLLIVGCHNYQSAGIQCAVTELFNLPISLHSSRRKYDEYVTSECTRFSLLLPRLTFRHRASCILGQAFHYSPENAFYIFNQQIYFII